MRLDLTWWISQGLALVALVFVVISFQQNVPKKIILYRCVATLCTFVGVCFFGDMSAIVLNATSQIRSIVALYSACHPRPIKSVEMVLCGYTIFVLLFLNLAFWQGYLSILSIAVGVLKLFSFVQKTPKLIRVLSAGACIMAAVYYSLLMSPINIAIEVFSLIAVIVGMIRFDFKKQDIKIDI